MCKLCLNRINNCQLCSIDGSTCTQCNDNYYLFSGATACVRCNLPTQYISTANSDGTGVCSLCAGAGLPDCVECSGDLSKCTLCAPSKYLWDADKNGVYNECVDCPEVPVRYPSSTGISKFNMILNLLNKKKIILNLHSKWNLLLLDICHHCSERVPSCEECISDGCQKCPNNLFIENLRFRANNNVSPCVPCSENTHYKGSANSPDGRGI